MLHSNTLRRAMTTPMLLLVGIAMSIAGVGSQTNVFAQNADPEPWSNPTLDTLRGGQWVNIELPFDLPGAVSLDVPNLGVIDLVSYSVWVPGATVEIIGDAGNRQTIAAPRVNTYVGVLRGAEGFEVRALLGPRGLRALISGPGLATDLHIEPTGEGNKHVVYTQADLAPIPAFCDGPARERQDLPGDDVPADNRLAPADSPAFFSGGMAAAEIGIDCDYAFFLQNGSSIEAALSRMSFAILTANRAFRDVGIVHHISHGVVRTSPGDTTYTTNSAVLVHDEIIASWRNNFSDTPHDLIIMFTGRRISGDPSDPGDQTIGQVNLIGNVCNRPDDTAAFGTRAATTWIQNNDNEGDRFSDADLDLLIVHELGHLWNARHCNSDNTSGCFGVTPCLVMCSTLGSCQNADGVTEFSTCNAGVVRTFRDSRSCLDPVDSLVYVWVDAARGVNAPGLPVAGTYGIPFRTVSTALEGPGIVGGPTSPLPPGATIIIHGQRNGTPEPQPLVIDQFIRLRSYLEPATIGQP